MRGERGWRERGGERERERGISREKRNDPSNFHELSCNNWFPSNKIKPNQQKKKNLLVGEPWKISDWPQCKICNCKKCMILFSWGFFSSLSSLLSRLYALADQYQSDTLKLKLWRGWTVPRRYRGYSGASSIGCALHGHRSSKTQV